MTVTYKQLEKLTSKIEAKVKRSYPSISSLRFEILIQIVSNKHGTYARIFSNRPTIHIYGYVNLNNGDLIKTNNSIPSSADLICGNIHSYKSNVLGYTEFVAT